ncbi:NDxxF motif lipoprotein [Ornithinibacillus bavariensis]|uniref:NDxxF motif lipoprotein n=1 Tax=Ornithinibacillus bavariensis TaxID=545502 RepID=UPI000EC2A559|nr:NDxxF motif lipoprotein [Ornithinibacillus sp.]
MIRRLFISFLIVFILSACSHEENIHDSDDAENDILSTEDVKVPSGIFTSEKQNSVIDEEEIRLSIKTYLDSHEELDQASIPFQEIIYEGKELNKNELEKLAKITKLTIENDENFANYIINNTLPDDYKEESERISNYITAYNDILYELGDILTDVTDSATKGEIPKINIGSIMNKMEVVNGREQKKIEEFLDKKNIKTKAFGREDLEKE